MISLAIVVATSASLVVFMPWTPNDSLQHVLENGADSSDRFTWSFSPNGLGKTHHTLELGISEEDFIDSFDRDILRHGSRTVSNPSILVDADDTYVRAVADHVLGVAEGRSEHQIATAALNFVQTAIAYRTDSRNYGCDDFWASPLETLYLHSGDCEDKAVLLCSIYGALGIRSVLLDGPGHIAVGVYLGDSEDYLFCETTCNQPIPVGRVPPGTDTGSFDICRTDEITDLDRWIGCCYAWTRYLIEDVTGI